MRTSIFKASVLVASLLAAAAPAFAEEAPKEPPKPTWTFALHGFVGASIYMQDGLLAPSGGTNAIFAASDRSARNMVFSGDVRSTRLNFSIAGPSILGGGIPKGIAEIDFFGGNGQGGFGMESVLPRLRYADVEVAWANDTIMVGQWHSFALGVNTIGVYPLGLPEWVDHTAFPVCIGAGCLGWRYPGLYYFHRMGSGDTKFELAGAVMKSMWQNNANPVVTVASTTATGATFAPGTNTYFNSDFDLGAASGVPAFEGRAMMALGKSFAAMISGRWAEINAGGTLGNLGTGTCVAATPQFCGTHTNYLGDIGVMLNAAGLTFKGHAFYGQNTYPIAGGEILQVQATAGGQPTFGVNTDVPEWGAFGQVGYDFSKTLSFWFLAGTQHPDYDKAYQAFGKNNAVREVNTVTSALLRYRENGWSLGLEWTHWHTRFPNVSLDVNQYDTAVFYYF